VGDIDCIHGAQDMVEWQALVNMATNCEFIKGWKLDKLLKNYYFFVPWSEVGR